MDDQNQAQPSPTGTGFSAPLEVQPNNVSLPQALRSRISIQDGISIYSVKPGTLEFKDGVISLVRDDGIELFRTEVTNVTKIKSYGDLLYIWIGRKSFTINFANNKQLEGELKAVAFSSVASGAIGDASHAISAAGREASNYATVESWITLFNSYGIKAKHKNLYRSKWTWALIAIVTLLFFMSMF